MTATTSPFSSYHPEGDYRPGPYRTGDLILTHGTYWSSRLIRLGQRLRYPREYAYYNHAVLVLDAAGATAEALGGGVVRGHVDDYENTEYHYVEADIDDHDAYQVREFVESVLAARWQYGYLTMISVALTLLTSSSLVFARAGTAICSGFYAEAVRPAGFIFDRPAMAMTPAGLAQAANVRNVKKG